MGYAPGLKGMLKDDCKVKPSTGEDDYGVPTVGTAVDRKCFFDGGGERSVKDENGRDVDVDGVLYFLPDAAPNVEDEVEYGGSDWEIVRLVQEREPGKVGLVAAWVNRK